MVMQSCKPLSLFFSLSPGPTTVTTTDQIRYLSVGRVFEGADVRIDDPDSEGQGEVRMCVCLYVCTSRLESDWTSGDVYVVCLTFVMHGLYTHK